MPEELNLLLNPGSLKVIVGQPAWVTVTVQNFTNQVQQFSLGLAGGAPGWAIADRVEGSVLPGNASPSANIKVQVPANIPAGAFKLLVKVTSGTNPGLDLKKELPVEVMAAQNMYAAPPVNPTGPFGPESLVGLKAPQVLLTLDRNQLSFPPGAIGELQITIKNLTNRLDAVSATLEGLDNSWAKIIQQDLTVFPQSDSTARLVIQPTADHAQAVAGIYPFKVKAKSRENPGREGEALGELEIQLVGDYVVQLGQAEARGVLEGSYPVYIRNRANAPLRIDLKAEDPSDALWYRFDPPQLVLKPGSQELSTLAVRPKRAENQSKMVNFSIVTTGVYDLLGGKKAGAQDFQVSGRFLQEVPPPLNVLVEPKVVESANNPIGNFRVILQNPAPKAVNVRLEGQSNNNALSFRFEPSDLRLDPGRGTPVSLTVQVNTGLTMGSRQSYPFKIYVSPAEKGLPPVQTGSTEGTLLLVAPQTSQQYQPLTSQYGAQPGKTPPAEAVSATKKKGRFPWLALGAGLLILLIAGVIMFAVLSGQNKNDGKGGGTPTSTSLIFISHNYQASLEIKNIAWEIF